ncbi:MAG: hypothetical protein JSR61_17420 [Proteobacteria bacterium]|nr:hypothetical protein [Pseudomonadota bacterium]
MQDVQKQHVAIEQGDAVVAARALIAKLPERKCATSTHQLYVRTFYRMWYEPEIDAIRPGIARDTYQVRRAALHYGARRLISSVLKKLDELSASYEADRDPQRLQEYQTVVLVLENMVRRLTPAIDRDPPLWDDKADFSQASRWKAESGCTKARGAGSKKHVLPKLPRNWISRFWGHVPTGHKYRDAIAVLSISPARVGEVVPGDRPSGFSDGVHVALDGEGLLTLTHAPQKTRGGKYGMEFAGVKVDPEAEGPTAQYLAERCREEGGALIVAVQSPAALSKAIKRIGCRAFPDGPAITPNVLRSQRIADAKVAFGAGEKVAQAAGQCTDRTQSKYGNVTHGSRSGLRDAFSSRTPKLVAVARARDISSLRKNSLTSVI